MIAPARARVVVGSAAGGLAAVALLIAWSLRAPSRTAPTSVEIPSGFTRSQIAARLSGEGVIRSRLAFQAVSRISGGTLRAGEYEFAPGEGLSQVVAKLRSGRVRLHALTVPEGFDAGQIAAALEARGLMQGDAFREAIRDPALLADHGIRAPSAEGYLFPDTYRIPRGVAPRTLAQMMLARFEKKVDGPLRARAGPMGLTFHQALTLASLVEHEAGTAAERPLVAAVFHNRRRARMRLESCASVYFALKLAGKTPPAAEARQRGAGVPGAAGRLRLAALDVESPYNTYRRAGLPPGPICNPGLAAIEAALSPAPVGYLFFVSRGDGTNEFAKSYEEFLKEKRDQKRRSRWRAANPKG